MTGHPSANAGTPPVPNAVTRRLRHVGLAEGISCLLLFGIGMPLKYAAGMPLAVSITGALHGALFLLYLLALAHAWMVMRWSFARAALLFIAGVLPFGTFVSERWLRRQEAEPQR